MFLGHHFLPKVAKNCQKKSQRVTYFTGSDNAGSDNMGMISLDASQRLYAIFFLKIKQFSLNHFQKIINHFHSPLQHPTTYSLDICILLG